MKKPLLLVILIAFTLPAYGLSYLDESEKAQNLILSYFEEADNRCFDITYPIMIENENCYEIVINGILNNGKEYYIDTIAVNMETRAQYYYDNDTGQFQRFYNSPWFACATSTGGSKRAESVGMNSDGPSGRHSLKEMRIIDLATGNVLWSAESYLDNKFVWSENDRFVAVEYSGRQWTQTDVVDADSFNIINIPDSKDILEAYPQYAKPNINAPIVSFKAHSWKGSEIIRINFEWETNNDTVVHGEYEFNVIDKTLNIYEIDEVHQG